jgi:hypothetical protein
MNWSEEKYVKLFTRDTPTWRAWPWQARALAPLLMRVLEGEGRLATGRLEPVRAVALTVDLPIEVVAVGLPAMLEDGTLELREDGLWWPKYEEAQESRKSEALRSREHRAKQRRESSTPTRHAASHGVTQRHTPSPSSPAQPSTAQLFAATPEAPPQSPKPPRKPSPQQEFFRWAQAEASKASPARLPEVEPAGSLLNAQLKIPLAGIGRLGLEAVWRAYMRDPYATSKGLPWALFVSKIPELNNRAPAAAPPKSRTLAPGEDPYAEQTA